MFPSSRIAAAFAIGLALAAGTAQAHARLVSAQPGDGAQVKGPPNQLDLHFSEGVLMALSGVALTDASGHAARLGPIGAVARDAKHLRAPIPDALAPGVYTVHWHAVAADTHRSSGQYRFTIR
jgi:methionine-rich copper-binding protein CopC